MGSSEFSDSRLTQKGRRTVDAEVVLDLVSDFLCVEVEMIKMKSRKRKIVFPRQVCMYLMTYYTSLSLRDIGQMFGGKDHTTVIHSKETVQDLMKYDLDIKDKINFLTQKLDNYAQARYQALNGSDTIYPGHA